MKNQANFALLHDEDKAFLEDIYKIYPFSFQECKQLIDMAIDLRMWQEDPIKSLFNKTFDSKKEAFNGVRKVYEFIKSKPHSYDKFSHKYQKKDHTFYEFQSDKIALGSCPVSSEGTRCCKLLTLDAVNSCGFDCSYCSIQSFYKQDSIGFDKNFSQNLKNLKLEKDQIFHIGTGQSSDSLMWGDKNDILSSLNNFAFSHENLILELKTKSNNINFFQKHKIAKNIIVTWSLNTPTIIENEEHLSASLDERLNSARALADLGILVGFHFHPMVVYEGYKEEYKKVFEKIKHTFKPSEIVMISFGTLTFIRPVINKIRKRGLYSKILQMPFCDINGKYSYSYEQKKHMFSFAYENLKVWKDEVFFYMCMEDKRLWLDVFGYEYDSNEEFEKSMKDFYMKKIKDKKC